jgi:hypothetical protein
MVARHNGIFSLGLISALAVSCGLVASLIVLPLILRLLPTHMLVSSSPQEPCQKMELLDVSPPCATEENKGLKRY